MFQNILAVFGTCMDTTSSIIFAIGLGFASMPIALGFLVGGAGMILYGQVAPISMQAQTLVYVSSLTKDRREQASIGIFSGLLLALLGLSGIIGQLMDFVGISIVQAVIAGAGIMLAGVSVNLIKTKPLPGIVSVAAGMITYLLTSNIVYTIIAAMGCSTLVYNIFMRKEVKAQSPMDLSNEKIHFMRPTINWKVIRGILVVCTFTLGSIISDASVTSSFAGMSPDSGGLSTYLGLSSLASSLFGGPPLGFVVSGAAASPDPIICGVTVMVIMAILLFTRVIPRITRYIPGQAMAGALMVLGVLVMFPANASSALGENPIVASVTILITAVLDPFLGMCAGVLVRYLLLFLGIS